MTERTVDDNQRPFLISALWRRAAANLFDGLFTLVSCVLFVMLRTGLLLKEIADPGALSTSQLLVRHTKHHLAFTAIVVTVFLCCYFVGLEYFWRRGTFGKIIFRVRIAADDGGEPGFRQTLKRLFGKFFFGFFTLGLSWAAAILSKDRQAWHDRFAKTIVIVVPEGKE